MNIHSAPYCALESGFCQGFLGNVYARFLSYGLRYMLVGSVPSGWVLFTAGILTTYYNRLVAGEQTKIEWQRLLEEALTAPGHLGNVYSRFHNYSITNMFLFMMQGIHEPVASWNRWKALGRHVVRGARAKEVIVPVLINEPAPMAEDEPIEEKRERVARLIGFKVVRAVFGLSDTEGKELPPVQIPGWNEAAALDRLAIRQVPFESSNGNLQGWSRGTEYALNPIAVNPAKTKFHEWGHIVLGHTILHHFEEYQAHRGIMEFQAEAVAYLCMNELEVMDEDTAAHSRGYIRHWLGEEQPPNQAIRQVFTAADRILRAGRAAVAADEASTPISTPITPKSDH